MVLVHVQPVGRDQALGCHAGPDDLGQPVDIQRAQAEQFLDPGAHGVGPRLGAEQARGQPQPRTRAEAGLRQCLAQPDRVRRRAGQDVRAQVAQQRHLPRGHPAGDRHHRGAELDRALVQSEAAGEQPVAVGVVDDAGRPGAGGGQRPRAHARP